MRTILIYTSPNKCFDEETARQVKIQKELEPDALLFTNFPHEGATVIPDIYFSDMTSVKIPVIIYLIENNLLPDDLYWYHDFDVYLNTPFDPPKVEYFALSKYGYKDEWQCGSFFFRPSALPLFKRLYREMQRRSNRTRSDEKYLTKLVRNWVLLPQEVNLTYNLTYKFLSRTLKMVEKPIKAVHFHLKYKRRFKSLVTEKLWKALR